MPTAKLERARIHYRLEGEGPNLTLLHCWTGNLTLYDDLVSLLPRKYQYLRADFPGHGKSPRASQYTPAFFGELIEDLWRRHEVGETVVIGHSLGGMVGLWLAVASPAKVKGLVLLSSTPGLLRFPGQREAGLLSLLALPFTTCSVRALGISVSAFHPLTPFSLRLRTAAVCAQVDRWVAVQTLAGIVGFDVRFLLSQVRCPVLVVAGSADIYTDIRHTMFLYREIQGARIRIVPRCGHMGLIERPAAVAGHIEAFLNDIGY